MAEVPVVVEFGARSEAQAPQPVVHIVPLGPTASGAAEESATEGVAASFRNDVDVRSAHFGLAQPTREGQVQFLRIRRVHDEPGHAAAVERGPDVEAIHLDSAFIPSTAVAVEDAHRRYQSDLLGGSIID